MTVIAHQKQIEELRESFRQKVLEAENWPDKVINTFGGRQCMSKISSSSIDVVGCMLTVSSSLRICNSVCMLLLVLL